MRMLSPKGEWKLGGVLTRTLGPALRWKVRIISASSEFELLQMVLEPVTLGGVLTRTLGPTLQWKARTISDSSGFELLQMV